MQTANCKLPTATPGQEIEVSRGNWHESVAKLGMLEEFLPLRVQPD